MSLHLILDGPLFLLISTNYYVFASEVEGSMTSTSDNAENADNAAPLLSAVSGSTKQLFHLLRCINFGSKTHVQITKEGLRFTVEESQVMQGRSMWRLVCV